MNGLRILHPSPVPALRSIVMEKIICANIDRILFPGATVNSPPRFQGFISTGACSTPSGSHCATDRTLYVNWTREIYPPEIIRCCALSSPIALQLLLRDSCADHVSCSQTCPRPSFTLARLDRGVRHDLLRPWCTVRADS